MKPRDAARKSVRRVKKGGVGVGGRRGFEALGVGGQGHCRAGPDGEVPQQPARTSGDAEVPHHSFVLAGMERQAGPVRGPHPIKRLIAVDLIAVEGGNLNGDVLGDLDKLAPPGIGQYGAAHRRLPVKTHDRQDARDRPDRVEPGGPQEHAVVAQQG